MKYKIILVPFPFDDLSGTKLRPALCLTDSISGYEHLVIAFITSQISKATESSDIPVEKARSDFSQTGLKVDSAIRLHRMVTIPKSLILRELGVLPEFHVELVKKGLKRLFSI